MDVHVVLLGKVAGSAAIIETLSKYIEGSTCICSLLTITNTRNSNDDDLTERRRYRFISNMLFGLLFLFK